MPLDNIRKTSSEIKKFLKTLNITETNFNLYERMLSYRDDVFVSVFNSLVDEKITIEDTNPDLSKIWKIDTPTANTLSASLEGKSKLLGVPKDLVFAKKDGSTNGRVTAISIYDQTKSKLEREKAIEVSNLSQTLVNTLTEENKIDDPYVVLYRDKFKEDFKKAASLYLLIKNFPEKDSESLYHNSGIDILELFIPDFLDIYTNHLAIQEGFNEFSFFERFKKEVFLPDGFSFEYSELVEGEEVQHSYTVKHSDLAIISDEVLTQVVNTIDQEGY